MGRSTLKLPVQFVSVEDVRRAYESMALGAKGRQTLQDLLTRHDGDDSRIPLAPLGESQIAVLKNAGILK